jgi:hypothetical protein
VGRVGCHAPVAAGPDADGPERDVGRTGIPFSVALTGGNRTDATQLDWRLLWQRGIVTHLLGTTRPNP